MNTDPTETQSNRSTQLYRGLLLVARVLAILASCATLLVIMFAWLMSGAGHGTIRISIERIVAFALLVALPLLLLWPDSGPGTRSRKMHGAGIFGLALVMLAVLNILWEREYTFKSGLQSSLANLTIYSVEMQPVEHLDTIIGYKLKTTFVLNFRPKTPRIARATESAMEEAVLGPADNEDIDIRYFKEDRSKRQLERPSGEKDNEGFYPELYTLTKQVWMPFIDLPEGATEPCREDPAKFPKKFVDEVSSTRAGNWVLRVQNRGSAFINLNQKVMRRIPSQPLLTNYDGASWLSNLSSLSLQPCKSR